VALEFLRQHPTLSPAFNENNWGGYLIWSGRKVFIDGRSDVYEQGGVLEDFLLIHSLDRSTLALLCKYRVRSCLIKRSAPLNTLLASSPDWEIAYEDNVATVFALKEHPSTGSPTNQEKVRLPSL
jgi:hypothetical protein